MAQGQGSRKRGDMEDALDRDLIARALRSAGGAAAMPLAAKRHNIPHEEGDDRDFRNLAQAPERAMPW